MPQSVELVLWRVVLVVAAYGVHWRRPGLWHRLGAYVYMWAVVLVTSFAVSAVAWWCPQLWDRIGFQLHMGTFVAAGVTGTVLLVLQGMRYGSQLAIGFALVLGLFSAGLGVFSAYRTRQRLGEATRDSNEG
jgi:hypothetical protein